MTLSLNWFFPIFLGLFLGVLAMFLHELGHLIAALIVGVKVKNIGFRWKGLYVVREAGPPAKNLMISLAGPLLNLALVAFWPLSHEFGLANLCFAFFNLIPLRGSDGERAWICWDEMKVAAGSISARTRFSLPGRLVSTAKHSNIVSQVPLSGD